ncbi:carbohydrate ABC transporter permease, partial [uncultured Anaerococcus sp.]
MRKVLKVLSFIFIIIMAAVTLFPFLYMISSSLMSFGEVTQIPPKLLPKAPQFANYVEAMKAAPFARYFVNTVFVSLINTMGTLITTVLAAFALNFLNFKGKTVLQNFMLALLMVPFEIIIFTNYSTIAKLGLLDTYTALIIPFLASVFYIFYLKEFLKSVPMEFYNAAKVDGASDFEFIRRVMIPMCKQNLFT